MAHKSHLRLSSLAKYWMLAKAERCGLILKGVPDDELMSCCVTMAARAASVPSELAATVKKTIARMALIESHEQAVNYELGLQWKSMMQPEFVEKVRALQRRISNS